MRASDLTLEGNLSFLFKGPPGFGKTIAACSFAVAGPVYLAYFDKQRPVELLTFFKKYRPELLERIEYEVYGSQNANKYLDKLYELSKGCRYSAVITDSLTNATSAIVSWSMGFSNPAGQNKDKFTKQNQIKPGMEDYQSETGFINQALDLGKSLPTNVIWTAHPLPKLEMTGSGAGMKVTKTNTLVTVGAKVGASVPGNFTEIYHFGQETTWDESTGESKLRRIVSTEAVGDEFAKSALGLPKEIDFTNKLFYEVWLEKLHEVNV